MIIVSPRGKMKELTIIQNIKRSVGKPRKGAVLGIGDDCAVLEYSKNEYMLFAADMLVEGTHFTVKDAGYERIGRKAVAVNISDIAAMCGVPRYITVSIGLPPSDSENLSRGLYKGINKICREYGVQVVGGDTNRSDKIVIDVSIIGFVKKRELITRGGAKPGDVIFITGPVKDGKKTHLDFVPRVKESGYLAKNFKINSMIDVSDGIAMDLGRICLESRTGCLLFGSDIPLVKGLALGDALHYGESFELLFTMGEKEAERFVKTVDKKRLPFFAIGRILEKSSGMSVVMPSGKKEKLRMRGFAHLG